MDRLPLALTLLIAVAACGLTLEAGNGATADDADGSSSGSDTSASSSGDPMGTSSGVASSSSSGAAGSTSSSSSSSSGELPPPPDARPDGPIVSIPALGALTRLDDDDRVRAEDGPIDDNGDDDGAFELLVTGAVRGLILVRLDDDGEPTNEQWDTYVGADEIPEGFWHTAGRTSYQLGAFTPDGTLLNDAEGRLHLPDGTRTLHIYVDDAEYFDAGERYVAAMETDDGTVVRSPVYVVPE